MMRIEGISKSKVSFFVRLAFWFSQRRFGKVADPLKITGHHPWVSFGYGIFELAGERAHLVESRLKDLAQIKAATLVGCPFELTSALPSAEQQVLPKSSFANFLHTRKVGYFLLLRSGCLITPKL